MESLTVDRVALRSSNSLLELDTELLNGGWGSQHFRRIPNEWITACALIPTIVLPRLICASYVQLLVLFNNLSLNSFKYYLSSVSPLSVPSDLLLLSPTVCIDTGIPSESCLPQR